MKRKEKRRIIVRVAHRAEPDIRKLGRALVDLANAQAEADAQAAHRITKQPATDDRRHAEGGQS
jgi:hypothetical protein